LQQQLLILIPKTILKMKKEEEEKSKEKAAEEKAGEYTPFEVYVEQAMEDRRWLKLIAEQTGLPLMEKPEKISGIFIRHVIIMGKEDSISSVQGAKSYFANFARKGSVTYKKILAELAKEERREENPYRHENVDPQTGERSYCGIAIPRDAPPRPDVNAVWNKGNGRWER
jgi:hypothetical protein